MTSTIRFPSALEDMGNFVAGTSIASWCRARGDGNGHGTLRGRLWDGE
jgi:hypothetical protein